MRELRNGRYTLLRTLGEGSQAETWEARVNDASAQRPDPEKLASDFDAYVKRAKGGAQKRSERNPRGLVAIKCFRVGKAKSWKDVELAEREVTTLKAIAHPNLPRYVEHFEEDGALYLVMEKIEGESLVPGKTQGVDVVRMLEDVGDALRHLHGRSPSLVHRDVKPSNIIRRPDGSYALVDLGAVRDRLKPAGGSTVVGTFGYMAPEQFQGRASPQSDLYGLAATALAMITGRQPEDLPHEGLGIDVRASLPRGTSRALSKALSEMLEPDPDRRAGSIDEVLALLRNEKPSSKASNKPRRKRTSRRAARKPRERRPRVRDRDRGGAVWRVLQMVIIAVMIVTWYQTHKFLPMLAGGVLLMAIQRIRRAIAEPQPTVGEPQVRVAELEREADEEERRVRVAEETYEQADETEVDEEADDRSDKLRR